MKSKRRVRYAVIGAGNIAQVAVLPAFEHAAENSELVALLSRDPEKRSVLRARYDLELVGDYDELESILERGRIDAVYIATPNTLHKEFALRAAERGAHVLCEKPLAPTAADCEAMAIGCEENGAKLMVAYRLHFEEGNLKALAIARSGALGDLCLFSSVFTHVVRQGNIRRDPAFAGGATYDLGIYCINAARNLFDAEPLSVLAASVEKYGTDDTATAILRFPYGRLAQFSVSNGAASVSAYRLAGTNGDLRVEPAYGYADEIVHHLTIANEPKRTSYRKRDQFAPELIHFSDCILNDHEPEPSAEEGLCDVRVIEAVLKSAKTGASVDLAPYQRSRRPSLSQNIYEPPVREPEPVNAPGPSVR